jgi:glutathione peroxidase
MLKIVFVVATLFFTVSIYSISFNDTNGVQVNFSDFQGKKILIVNTASASPYVSQYASLEQLYQLYKDSLVIIAFPSNSFGHESGDNIGIHNFVTTNYNIHFMLGAKIDVTGIGQSAIYQWLTQQSQNGMMNSTIQSDFQKFLIEKDGKLVGVFSADLNPMDSTIQNAIKVN